jgi:hypothetical protein
MKRSIVVGMGCLLVGVAAARLVLNSPDADRERKPERPTADHREKRLGRFQVERIASLESDLSDLRVAQRTASPSADAATTLPPPARDGAPNPPTEVAVKTGKSMSAAAAAKLLGLEQGRRALFEESYERVLSKVQEAESRHASVSRQGDEVEIHIPPFPNEGAFLRQEWSGVLLTALTTQEQDRYKDLQLDQILFPRDLGVWDRYMVFMPEDTVWPKIENGNRYWPTFYERWTKPGEPSIDASARWPWGGPEAYRCYRHLLDPSLCRVREE